MSLPFPGPESLPALDTSIEACSRMDIWYADILTVDAYFKRVPNWYIDCSRIRDYKGPVHSKRKGAFNTLTHQRPATTLVTSYHNASFPRKHKSIIRLLLLVIILS